MTTICDSPQIRSAYERIPDEVLQAGLDDVLCRWHQWQGKAVLTRGMNRRSLVVGDYQPEGGYRVDDDAVDADTEHRTMRVVDFQLREMADPYRTAIHVIARAVTLGVTVFSSPRLPQDRVALDIICTEARRQAIDRLVRVGVLA